MNLLVTPAPSPAGSLGTPAAAGQFHLPDGWEIDQTSGGDFIVNKPGVGGYVASLRSDSIASVVLAHLARDLLAAALSQPESVQPAAPSDAIRRAGQMLSNCAFNLARRKPGEFTDRDIKALDDSRKAWDAALSVQPGAKGEHGAR